MKYRLPKSNKLKKYLDEQLIQAGLMTGHQHYTPFIVLGRYRVGSNLLVSSLFNHPNAVVFSEVFIPNRIYWGNRIYGHPDPYSPGLLAERDQDPVAFLNKHIFRPYAAAIQAVGFKIFYPQLDHPSFASLKDYLQDIPLHVIHLRRQNLLNVQISNEVSRQSGKTIITSSKQAAKTVKHIQAFDLSPKDCEVFFEQVESEQARYATWFTGHPTLDLVYEDFQASFTQQLEKVQQFLGLPSTSLAEATAKQNTRRQRALVSNYDELQAYFEGTKWATFFTDPPTDALH